MAHLGLSGCLFGQNTRRLAIGIDLEHITSIHVLFTLEVGRTMGYQAIMCHSPIGKEAYNYLSFINSQPLSCCCALTPDFGMCIRLVPL